MEFFLSLLLKSDYFSDIIMNQWAEVLNTDLRICSNTHFIWPKNVSAFVNFKIGACKRMKIPAVCARLAHQNLFLAIESSNPSLCTT
jgi:hypothetical protein